ncbi:catalase [Kineococcus rhizosphaerae]|uniref:Catalase n=2 Tax=Kineococcus rhizosphaerae TaxID=559628 RepID=A0A2T0R6I0_9ACTN|nr:catalase [Kineococcus rhizosphaerae]PRY16772.1 catalase [Kineococcus rhizosphaerae]
MTEQMETTAPGAPTTNDAGIPVASDEHSLTQGPGGGILLHDAYLIEKMAQFNRERVPERVVHAKGGGAFGEFRVTGDVSAHTRAALFQPGTTTPVLARFSTVAGESGTPDTWRDPRGFSLKFYTSEGNYDLVGNNTPVFFVKDPLKFQDFIRSQKRRADNHLRDHDMQWDFWTLSPESAHQVTWLMGDRGIPRTWRHMNGYGSHTFQWINAEGERTWVKYTFKTDQGNEFFTQDEADQMASIDTDYHIRDLNEHIRDGEFPSWTLFVQLMPDEDAAGYRFNPFDVTKVWPHSDYPLHEVGKLTLNRNPENYFAEIEQAAFEPSNMVPGIGVSPDKMLLGRMFSYADAHRYRIGANYAQLPVNHAKAPVNSYAKDGAMRYSNPGDPVYAPNSYGGPAADAERAGHTGRWDAGGEPVRAAYEQHAEDDDWGQAHALLNDVMDDAARGRFVDNVVGHLLNGVSDAVLTRAFGYWDHVDAEIGRRIREGVSAKQDLVDPKAEEQGNPARSSAQHKA